MTIFNRRMNYLMALLFTVLVACGQPVQEIELAPPTVPPETITEFSERDLYLTTIRTQFPVLDNVDDQSLVDLGKNTCGLLDTGGTVQDVFQIASDSGLPPEMAGFITGAAIATYCPEHTDQIE